MDVVDELGDGGVKFREREEAPMAQTGEDPALHDLRATRTCRQHGGAVVGGEFGHRPLRLRLVAVRITDHRRRVVGHDRFRDTANELQCAASAPTQSAWLCAAVAQA